MIAVPDLKVESGPEQMLLHIRRCSLEPNLSLELAAKSLQQQLRHPS